MRKAVKIIGWVIVTPIVLFIVATLLLYFPPFQNWAVGKVAAIASEKTGMTITVEHVNLQFPLNLGISGLRVIQPNDSLPQVRDTIADVGHLVADVQLLPLFSKQVEVDELDFHRLKLNTVNLIHSARVKGKVGRLRIVSHGIDLGRERLRVNDAMLTDGNIDVALSDTVPPDTTESKNYWKISVDRLHIARTHAAVHMPGDTLRIGVGMKRLIASKGYFDLYKVLYQVNRLDWTGGELTYDDRFQPRARGLDTNHISLSDISLGVDSLKYLEPALSLRLRECCFEEKSGIKVNRLSGPLSLDSTHIWLPDLTLQTPHSKVKAKFDMDFNAFADNNPGKMNASVNASIGRGDIMMFLGQMPSGFRRKWPLQPLRVDGSISGNLKRADMRRLSIDLPTAFSVKASGWMGNLTDMAKLKARLNIDAYARNLDFITSLLGNDLPSTVNIPHGIGFRGNVGIDGKKISSAFVATQGGGLLKGKAGVDTRSMTYDASLTAVGLPVGNFLTGYGLKPFSGSLQAKGTGTDFLSPHTSLAAKASVGKFGMSGYNFDKISLSANVAGGRAHIGILSRNPLLDGQITLDALLNQKWVKATLGADISKADLYHLCLTDTPLTATLCGHIDVASNLKSSHKLQAFVSDIVIRDHDRIVRPDDIVADVLTRPDTTHAIIDCGDFHLNLDANAGYERLLSHSNGFLDELSAQLKAKTIDQSRLRQKLPNGHISLESGEDNFFLRVLRHYGYTFRRADINMASSPVSGINGWMNIDSLVLVSDSVRLDTIRVNFSSDADNLNYSGYIRNGAQSYPSFTARFDGGILENGLALNADLYDYKDRLGISLPLYAAIEPDGMRLRVNGDKVVLGYKKFAVNTDNYLSLKQDNRVSAKMTFTADDGQGIQIYTDDANADALQDITVSLHQFDLEDILSVIPYTPDIQGIMNGDFHVIQTADELSVSSEVGVKNMVMENCPMGDVGTEFVYMPQKDGSHYVDGIISHNGNEVGTLKGTYKSEGDGWLDATVGLEEFPLEFVNGFIPQQIIGLRGRGEGSLTIKGPLSRPDINGEVFLDSSYLVSEPYGVEMRFADDPVTITNSRLLFENFEMFAHNDQPLDMSGWLDFSDPSNMSINARMRARNFELIDSKQTARSEAFGKAFVNFFGFISGPVANMSMRGRLEVLGSTDMTYILRDNELSTENSMEGLVEFRDFSDSTQVKVDRPTPEGLNMSLSISIDEQAHILAAFNSDRSNYIDLMGGGDLMLTYNPVTSLQLTGQYTLNNGEMKYALPVIPLKTFNIQEGSYILFTGDPMDPTLSITATENVKTIVNEEEQNGRQVEFVCGVKLSKTLSKPGIEFIISAPNDMTIQDQLNTMSTEEKGKVAIAMLASGMYLASGSTQKFSMNSALSSFLNSQINNIAGSAMRSMGLDLDVGIDNTVYETGLHTDYNFKFAKRFWNNRISIIVGGQVSSGARIEGQQSNNTFFNNVMLQYRLNQSSSQYMQLFYNNNTYDWLEGLVGEYGIGLTWRRKLSHFRDIFRLRETDKVRPPQQDSVKVKKE